MRLTVKYISKTFDTSKVPLIFDEYEHAQICFQQKKKS
jgi:hypothetical protein